MPWKNIKHRNKWGYLNNPNWTKDPNAVRFSESVGIPIGPTKTHIPCGHWHKGPKPTSTPSGNLYGSGSNDSGAIGFIHLQYLMTICIWERIKDYFINQLIQMQDLI